MSSIVVTKAAKMQVEGLSKIYTYGKTVSFEFDSIEKMKSAAEALQMYIQYTVNLAHTFSNGIPDNEIEKYKDKVLDALRSDLVPKKANSTCVIGLSIKEGGTMGKPMKTAEELINRLGNLLSNTSMTMKEVPIVELTNGDQLTHRTYLPNYGFATAATEQKA